MNLFAHLSWTQVCDRAIESERARSPLRTIFLTYYSSLCQSNRMRWGKFALSLRSELNLSKLDFSWWSPPRAAVWLPSIHLCPFVSSFPVWMNIYRHLSFIRPHTQVHTYNVEVRFVLEIEQYIGNNNSKKNVTYSKWPLKAHNPSTRLPLLNKRLTVLSKCY